MMKKLILPLILLLIFASTAALHPVSASGSAPIAENLELRTYRGVSVGGRLSATDPDGDELSYEITTEPVKGSIDLDVDGHFVYTPGNGKRGKDYFGYRATDPDGNRSQEATVIIRIEKQKSKINYADLSNKSCGYAAVRLAEEALFTGESLAGTYVFSPDLPITRAEFLSMCMKATGHEPTAGISSTGFADDDKISVWAKPYVCDALRCGIITGYAQENETVCFDPDRCISTAEAAVILDRAAQFTDAVAAWYADEDAVPAWARQAAANITSCGLLPYGCSFRSEVMTRAEAAEMLCAAIDLIGRR